MVMKRFYENGSDYSDIVSINSTNQEKKPYITMTYAETLPTGQASGITDKSIYRLKHSSHNKYITKNLSNGSYSIALETTNTTVGSTKNKSQFISVNYVGGGKYTLSFLIPPTSSNGFDTSTGYSTNLYLKVSTGTASSLSTSSGVTDNAKWYIIYNYGDIYKIINAKYPYRYLESDNNSNLTMSTELFYTAPWTFEYCGYDDTLYKQATNNTCGAACCLMVLKHFGISVTEKSFTNNWSLSGNYDVITPRMNYYLSNLQDPKEYKHDPALDDEEIDDEDYGPALSQRLSRGPVIVLCYINEDKSRPDKDDTDCFDYPFDDDMPYVIHFIELKGIYHDNNANIDMCIVNDPASFDDHSSNLYCHERLVPLSKLKEINQDDGGYMIYVKEN